MMYPSEPPRYPNRPQQQHYPPQPHWQQHYPQYASTYHYPPQPQHVVNVAMQTGTTPLKDPGIAALLAALGPLGMLYSTIPGAAVMLCANIVVCFIAALTFGLGWFLLVFPWIGGMVWAYIAANQHNARISSPYPYPRPPAAPYPPYPRPY